MKVSIIITLYNRAELVLRTIESCQGIDESKHEIIVIDDGSSDDPLSKLENYISSGRISYYRKDNGGAASAKNYGAKLASGEYIFFLDSDDTIISCDVFNEIIDSDLICDDFYYSNSVIIEDENGRHLSETPYSSEESDIYSYVLKYPLNYPGKPAYFFKREKFILAGGFNEKHRWGDAMYFWRVFLKNATCSRIANASYVYNFVPTDSVSRQRDSKFYDRVYDTLSDTYSELYHELNNKKYTHNWLLVILPLAIKTKKYKSACKILTKLFLSPRYTFHATRYVMSRRMKRG